VSKVNVQRATGKITPDAPRLPPFVSVPVPRRIVWNVWVLMIAKTQRSPPV